MKKIFCDKCGIEIWNVYTLKVDGFNKEQGLIWRQGGYITKLHFCSECINDISSNLKKMGVK